MSQEVQQHVLARYSLLKKVGSGAYGHVWKVTDKRTSQTLALKKIFDAFQHSVDAQRTYREICYLHELNHPNIVKLTNVIRADNDKDLYLVFEFMEADLHNAIGQKILKDVHNRYIMHQILIGMLYLHSAEVIHRDLKPSNILINSDCHLKICDFGLARSLVHDNQQIDLVLTQEVATRWYRAPQVLLGSQSYQKPADVWSIGCILAELLMGKPIFPGNSTLNQLQRILSFTGKPKREDIQSLNSQVAPTMIQSVKLGKLKSIRQWFKSDIPNDALDLLVRMLHFNPQKRISLSQALRHPYLAQFHKAREEINCKRAVVPPVSDNKKLSLKQYKQLIYDRIRKIYSEQEPGQKQYKKSASSLHRSGEVMREKSNQTRNQTRSSLQQKTTKTSSSKKYPPTPHSFHSYANNDEDKLRKKQSLKDILRNKRQKSWLKNDKSDSKLDRFQGKYDSTHKDKSYITSPVLAKYYKQPSTPIQNNYFKENMRNSYLSKY